MPATIKQGAYWSLFSQRSSIPTTAYDIYPVPLFFLKEGGLNLNKGYPSLQAIGAALAISAALLPTCSLEQTKPTIPHTTDENE
jgi:hypothetical protein